MHCLVSNREGLGLRRFIMRYRDPHSQKEHIEVTKSVKFGVDRANVEQDTATARTSLFLSKLCVFLMAVSHSISAR